MRDEIAELRAWLAVDPDLIGITDRQVEVVRLRADGLTLREIATRFGITPGTVRMNLSTAHTRIGIQQRRRAEAGQ